MSTTPGRRQHPADVGGASAKLGPMGELAAFDRSGGWSGVLGTLTSRGDLTGEVAASAMAEILDGNATPAQIAGFIVALRMKGVAVEDLGHGRGRHLAGEVAPGREGAQHPRPPAGPFERRQFTHVAQLGRCPNHVRWVMPQAG